MRDIATRVGNTAIIGISPDSVERQQRFAAKLGVDYPLLSDPDHAIAEAYGVWTEKKLYGRTYMGIQRSAFLVDPNGVLSHVWYKVSPKDTPTNLLNRARRAGVTA